MNKILDSDLGKIRRISNWIVIRDRVHKGYYFKYKGRVVNLSDFVRFNSIWSGGKNVYYTECGVRKQLAASDQVNYTGWIIEIDPAGEYVRLYEEVTE